MAVCPFCQGEISEQIALHGGTCPKCFGDVPGEEAATDPGEQLAARQRAEDTARAQASARRPLLFIGPIAALLLAAVGYGVYAQLTAPVVERLDFGDDEFTIDIELARYEEPPPGAEAPEADAAPKRAALLGTGGSRRASEGGAADDAGGHPVEGPGVTEAGGSAGGFDINFSAARTAALLTSKDDLQAAVRDLFKTRAGRLQQCYERSLKGNEGLAGTWRLSFTIDEEGKATEAAAAGQQMQDPAFEACLAQEMASWRLAGRLEKPWPVSLPVAFKP